MYTLQRGIPYADISGEVVTPDTIPEDWKKAEWVDVSLYPWDENGYTPEMHAAAAEYEGGLTLMMLAQEETISCKVFDTGGGVCVDSCMEFFVRPFPEDDRYLNCEINCGGTIHLAIGTGREDRSVWKRLPQGVRVSVSKHVNGWWAVSANIPAELLKECYGSTLAAGSRMRGNFYKCDETIHPHFGTWNPVKAEHPDFHRPECFGEMMVEE